MALPSLPPLSVERFRRDFAALGGNEQEGVGVAVSGGPDSLALLLLAHAAYPDHVRAATVDHGLRSESRAEADLVARYCTSLSIPHAILTVNVVSAGDGLQASARQARYGALGGWLESEGMKALLTAHHADDQAETLVMRLLRGSGVAGLAGVRSRMPFPAAGEDALILRPLLGWRRAALAEIVQHAGLQAVADPSNENEDFDRARIRRHLAQTPWLDPEPLARSAAALADAEEALDAAARTLAATRIEQSGGSILLDPGDIPNALLRRVILSCLRLIVPDAAPRGGQLTDLAEQLRRGRVATLAGVKCSGGVCYRFEPAPPRRASLSPDASTFSHKD
ncbi:tRNA lysidine(34) synthetase TilS [Sphingosinicella rhizophila]|uniref:tRNA(Ile)-lysidine synthase n=1 Tax=Sphingosinicella rhizophila TaxID=3050082 RepID=A0ABU3Q456_9SPHN|nr:tRNA lysidine(34) synthetase TilS [Sphingosinicella sp. GR2756]MDT9598184.1 tRNA lysidine(34) synthetase TilS [Sphingosinicella sp. GR2756]